MPVRIGWDGPSIHVRLDGMDAVWALRRRVTVPLRDIAGARVVEVDEAHGERPPLRAPGTYWPRTIVAGTYRGGAFGPQFWCVRGARQVLVLDLKAGPLARVVVEVDDPYGAAAAITNRVAGP